MPARRSLAFASNSWLTLLNASSKWMNRARGQTHDSLRGFGELDVIHTTAYCDLLNERRRAKGMTPHISLESADLSLRLIVAGRDERAAAVNGDDQALVP